MAYLQIANRVTIVFGVNVLVIMVRHKRYIFRTRLPEMQVNYIFMGK